MNTIQVFAAILGTVLAATAPATAAILFSIRRTDEMSKQLRAEIKESVAQLSGRIDAQGARLEGRIDVLGGRIDTLSQQVSGVDARLARVEVLVSGRRTRGAAR